MAGTLVLSQDLCWMPAGWIYDAALEHLAVLLNEQDEKLSELFRNSLMEVNGGFLSLEEAPIADLKLIENALGTMIEMVKTAGPDAMFYPKFFDGYVNHLEELGRLLAQRLKADQV
ncbi:hypothetical protein FYZ48_18950 [Gimesia chilikensis]|uniref:hypothetical protein n=1 Tax=Gimesia chilikensis TaxID=2605989 RepID=UPI0011EFFD6A|nr:hypothetical protein [Gimesia chilikensis]KAA0135389.1 hypothetical protein FYZ48_18950 [Gimesia chilikensis]